MPGHVAAQRAHALLARLEQLTQFAGHGDGMDVGVCCETGGLSKGDAELIEPLPQRAGDLAHAGKPAVLDPRHLEVRSAYIIPGHDRHQRFLVLTGP